jgi:hypothetical protein
MAMGITDHIWTIGEFADAALADDNPARNTARSR